MCGLMPTMTTPTHQPKMLRQYDTLSAFYLDQQTWESMKPLYEAIGQEPPPKPEWNPSANYIEYDYE